MNSLRNSRAVAEEAILEHELEGGDGTDVNLTAEEEDLLLADDADEQPGQATTSEFLSV
jgi:hypothetical protein